MSIQTICKPTIAEAWEESLRLFFKKPQELHHAENRGDACLEIEDLVFDIKYPHREPRISSLFPTDYIPLIESFTERLINPQEGNTSTINDRMFRWRKRDGTLINQLETEIQLLRTNPGGRYSIIGFWDPEIDLLSERQVGPIMVYFRVRSKKLNATLVTRSLDALVGAVQLIVGFANLQSYLAQVLNIGMGSLHVLALSYHIPDIEISRVMYLLESSTLSHEKVRRTKAGPTIETKHP